MRYLPLLFLTLGCGRLGFDYIDEAIDADGMLSQDAEIRCGNGVLEGSEDCDDGNDISGDGCEETCVLSYELSGQADFLEQPPPDLNPGVFEQDTVFLILERNDEVLAAPFPLDAFTRGQVFQNTSEAGTVPAGARVNVYLVHAKYATESSIGLSARIQFPYEILGLIIQGPSLLATDLPTITYDTGSGREIEDPADIVFLEERALDVTLQNGTRADEIRIVVATKEAHGISVAP